MSNNEQLTINAIRALTMDAVQKANSGHPGMPMGAAPMAYTLWAKHLNHCPKNPLFYNRDRFVLSAGHGSMLLYSLLHLFGYGMTKEELMSFRQLKSTTPGHPEYNPAHGVEVSTGPLGHGFANAVGMALAEKILAERFNKEDATVIDHRTYVIVGDGCLMEGISYEAASLAGKWGLGKLIALYDSNGITIEGNTGLSFTEDIKGRFEAQGWQVLTVADGEDTDQIDAALTLAKAEYQKPSLIIVNTIIGAYSPLEGNSACHGAPLGEKNIQAAKKAMGWKAAPFELPAEVVKHTAEICEALNKTEAEWNKTLKTYKSNYPQEYEEFLSYLKCKIDPSAIEDLWKVTNQKEATRKSSNTVLNKFAAKYPFIVGGAGDLGPSTMTLIAGSGVYDLDECGRNIAFGIREHAMAAICNGLYVHGGIQPYCATFLVFSDFLKPAVRMSALMNIPVLYVFSHDSIGVGEDGPTHQPIEQLTMLRTIPNLNVIRPADAKETVAAYITAFTGKKPTAIIATRQGLPQLKNTGEGALLGGYIVSDSQNEVPEVILIASGSELQHALEAKKLMDGTDVRVVSMPSMNIFDAQSAKYRESVLPSACRARVTVEAGSTAMWYKYAGLDGECVGVDVFASSAPAEILMEIYGITAEDIVKAAKKTMRNVKKS